MNGGRNEGHFDFADEVLSLNGMLNTSLKQQVHYMVTMDEWAEFYSGEYQGWIRSPRCDWEDLIGKIRIACTANKDGLLNVIITILEFGTWTGCLRLMDGVMEGSTGQGDIYFKCVFQERGEGAEIQGCFYGEIYEPPARPLFEFNFASDWRKRHPDRLACGK